MTLTENESKGNASASNTSLNIVSIVNKFSKDSKRPENVRDFRHSSSGLESNSSSNLNSGVYPIEWNISDCSVFFLVRVRVPIDIKTRGDLFDAQLIRPSKIVQFNFINITNTLWEEKRINKKWKPKLVHIVLKLIYLIRKKLRCVCTRV